MNKNCEESQKCNFLRFCKIFYKKMKINSSNEINLQNFVELVRLMANAPEPSQLFRQAKTYALIVGKYLVLWQHSEWYLVIDQSATAKGSQMYPP